MERLELLQIAEQTFKKCLDILDKKNHDYTKDNSDALRNFKAVEFFRLTDAPTGILVRLSDKFMRICNLSHGDKAKVVGESLQDTIDDMINYLVLYKASLMDK